MCIIGDLVWFSLCLSVKKRNFKKIEKKSFVWVWKIIMFRITYQDSSKFENFINLFGSKIAHMGYIFGG